MKSSMISAERIVLELNEFLSSEVPFSSPSDFIWAIKMDTNKTFDLYTKIIETQL